MYVRIHTYYIYTRHWGVAFGSTVVEPSPPPLETETQADPAPPRPTRFIHRLHASAKSRSSIGPELPPPPHPARLRRAYQLSLPSFPSPVGLQLAPACASAVPPRLFCQGWDSPFRICHAAPACRLASFSRNSTRVLRRKAGGGREREVMTGRGREGVGAELLRSRLCRFRSADWPLSGARESG